MKRLFISTMLTILCGLSALCQNTNFKPSFSIGFDSLSGRSLLKQCSRATPKNISSFWTVSQNDIDNLESNFSNIDSLTAKECCIVGMKIHNLKNFGFQYVGVIIKNRKYIYINAFPFSEIEMMKKYQPTFDPTKSPMIVCDGGSSFWGVLFDINTKEFNLLSFNGIA